MLKTHMAACLVASALATIPALAQTTTAPSSERPTATGSGSATSGSPAMQPGGTAGGTAAGSGMSGGASGSTGAASGGTGMGSGSTAAPPAGPAGSGASASAGAAASMKPLAAPQPGQVMGSDLRGTRVYGSNNESIGDISDLLIDKQGQVVAAIVGVGGFLGIGQKDVAVPFQALEIVPEGAASGSSASGPAATGTTGAASSGSGTATMNPERVVLRNMTRADLEAAPSFRSDGQASGSGSGSSGTAPQK
jgi:sporulation protein YlmC with PRC-barrel domain